MRITIDMIIASVLDSNYMLCRGVTAFQSDIQCVGYNHLCALAIMEKGNSYERVAKAKEKINSDPYYKGFQAGWDGEPFDASIMDKLGWEDGDTASKHLRWRRNPLQMDVVNR